MDARAALDADCQALAELLGRRRVPKEKRKATRLLLQKAFHASDDELDTVAREVERALRNYLPAFEPRLVAQPMREFVRIGAIRRARFAAAIDRRWTQRGEKLDAIVDWFWERCQPRRSTYPACRAMVLAREAGQGEAMLAAIQGAYYREARNPSDVAVLADLAGGLGLDAEAFAEALVGERAEVLLQADLTRARALGATSFPSLGLAEGDRERLLASGCLDATELRRVLGTAGLLAD